LTPDINDNLVQGWES